MQTPSILTIIGIFFEILGIVLIVTGTVLLPNSCKKCFIYNIYILSIVLGALFATLGLVNFFVAKIIQKRKEVLDNLIDSSKIRKNRFKPKNGSVDKEKKISVDSPRLERFLVLPDGYRNVFGPVLVVQPSTNSDPSVGPIILKPALLKALSNEV